MKYTNFIVWSISILIVMTVCGYYFFSQKNNNQYGIQKSTPQLKQTLRGKDLPALFGQEYVPSTKNWSVYVNEMFHFSMEIPPQMETRHSVNIWEQHGNEYTYYGVLFTDTTPDERILAVSIKETNLGTVEKYISQNGGYNGFIFEEKNISDTKIVIAITAPDPVHTTAEESRERHFLFIRGGFFFDITTRNMSISNVNRIWKSLRFLTN